MANMNDLQALLRKVAARQAAMERRYVALEQQHASLVQAIEDQPASITEEIDSLPGRRIFYTFGARQDFDISNNGLRGEPMSVLISQDGAFIATHYPLVIWKSNTPGAGLFGSWRPVSSWPLPTQQITDNFIDLSYEVVDGGNGRQFQNEAIGPIFSRPDNLVPLPVPTLFAPNSIIQFIPTYERIDFSDDETSEGQLFVGWPGYRIVNL